LTDKGDVKVIDFGIARAFHKPEDDADATVFDPGSLGGLTPAYASPEMVEHAEPDPRDDIYGLACITYEMLTGRHPFNRMSGAEARNTGMKPERPRQLGYKQWQALKAGLCFERAKRTPSIESFIQGLRGERRPAEYLVLGVGGLACVLLIAAGVGYYWEFRGNNVEKGPAPTPDTRVAAEPPARSPPAAPAAPTTSTAPSPPVPAPAPVLTVSAVAPVLAGLSCTALAPSVRGDAVQVQGYVANSIGRTKLKDMLAAVPGVKSVDLRVEQVSEEKCGVINALGPYWLSNRQLAAPATLHARSPNAQLVEGEPLVVNITTPAYDGYVTVDYYVLDGGVLHMVPSPRARANQAPANYAATIGGMGNWIISKPFGAELITLIVTPVPLFETMRPETEPKAAYLSAVEKRLEQLGAKYGRDKIAVDLLQVTTRPRRP
jgi:hypothetical protein